MNLAEGESTLSRGREHVTHFLSLRARQCIFPEQRAMNLLNGPREISLLLIEIFLLALNRPDPPDREWRSTLLAVEVLVRVFSFFSLLSPLSLHEIEKMKH